MTTKDCAGPMRIYKYDVPVDDKLHEFDIPKGGRIVHIQSQSGFDSVQFWAMVNPHAERVDVRRFLVVGTGHDFGNTFYHVGSTVVLGGKLVWHLLEEVQ